MPWFAVGDSTDDHPKILTAGNAAVGLWVRCGAYASAHLTDGVIPGAVAARSGTATQIAKLLASGLWHEAGHACTRCPQPRRGDYVMHGYLDANPSRRQVQERRRRATEKKRQQRNPPPNGDDSTADPGTNRAPAGEEFTGQPPASPGDAQSPRTRPAPPLPSRREGAGVGGEGAGGWGSARRHPLPDGFWPDAPALPWAAGDGHLDRLGGPAGLAAVTAAFTDWHRGRATLGADWQALWRKWVREQRERPGHASPDRPVRRGRRAAARRRPAPAAQMSVADRFASIETAIASDQEAEPAADRPLTLLPRLPEGGARPGSAALMPGQRPLMAALPEDRAEASDALEVLEAIADHGQAHAVALYGWRPVAALLVGDTAAVGEA
ncbi:hypothetical protein ACGF0D_13765 [Kitasatospora sp. NPDC048298]|uniref:hypothetical protein n=1 Tax=Kitasatospora sp. NPDC048298 TaxID=3364049 RepID=UPI003714FBFC